MTKPVKIAMIGDSMTDTAGEDCRFLKAELNKHFPGREFELFNYGVGGTRAGYGLWRLTNAYEHREKKFKPLVEIQPDIVLIESFAYNNGSDGLHGEGIAHFRDMHQKIVATLQEKTSAKLVYIVTIAPDTESFLKTVPNFKHTPVSIRRWMAEDRMVYLEEAIKIAHELGLPLVNIYKATLDANKKGTPLGHWVDKNDWIHPGEAGHQLIAAKTVEVLIKNGLI